MFRTQMKNDEALLFCFNKESTFGRSIHMLFVFFLIKVYWLDKNLVIVDSSLAKPFRFWYDSKKKSKYILECHSSVNFKIGTKLEIKE